MLSVTAYWENGGKKQEKQHGIQHCASLNCRPVMHTHTTPNLPWYTHVKKQLWNIQKCFKKYVYWYIHMYTNWPFTAKNKHAYHSYVWVLPKEVFLQRPTSACGAPPATRAVPGAPNAEVESPGRENHRLPPRNTSEDREERNEHWATT